MPGVARPSPRRMTVSALAGVDSILPGGRDGWHLPRHATRHPGRFEHARWTGRISRPTVRPRSSLPVVETMRAVAIVTTVPVSSDTPALDAAPLDSCGARTHQGDSGEHDLGQAADSATTPRHPGGGLRPHGRHGPGPTIFQIVGTPDRPSSQSGERRRARWRPVSSRRPSRSSRVSKSA